MDQLTLNYSPSQAKVQKPGFVPACGRQVPTNTTAGTAARDKGMQQALNHAEQVQQEFKRDAVKILGWKNPPQFIRRIEECTPSASGEGRGEGIYLTNYESIRDGKLDPFGGLMTVPYRAIKLKRYGVAFELNSSYFYDGAAYCKSAELQMNVPTLFDTDDELKDLKQPA